MLPSAVMSAERWSSSSGSTDLCAAALHKISQRRGTALLAAAPNCPSVWTAAIATQGSRSSATATSASIATGTGYCRSVLAAAARSCKLDRDNAESARCNVSSVVIAMWHQTFTDCTTVLFVRWYKQHCNVAVYDGLRANGLA